MTEKKDRKEKKESSIWENVLHIEDGNVSKNEGTGRKKNDRERAFIVTSENGASSVEEIGRNQEVVLISGEPDAGAERLNAMRHIIAARGTETMSIIAMEEPAELIQAVSKVLRYGCEGEHRDSLAEEMADVRIILDELSLMYGISREETDRIMDRKLQREMARIDAERRRSGNEDRD